MFYREMTGMTIEEARDKFSLGPTTVKVVTPDDVNFELDEDRIGFRLPDTTITVTESSYQAIGKWLEVPYKFLERQDSDLQHLILERLLRGAKGEVAVEYSDDRGVVDIRSPDVRVIDPRRLMDIASRVIDPEAAVVEFHANPEYVQFDVIAPEGFERGWGGDVGIGDITAGGLRFGHDRKKNLAPWMAAFLYRLACTNGAEVYDERYKIDARGVEVEELLHDLEARATLAFSNIETTIEGFYSLRDRSISDPSQAVLRVASETGVPDRTAMALIERVPEVIEDISEATMFDVVNLVTNQANDPGIRGRLRVRRKLEQGGGEQISEHISRCRTCLSKLN